MICVQLEPVESHMFCLFGHLRLPQPQVKWAKWERNFWNSADIHMVKLEMEDALENTLVSRLKMTSFG